MTRGEDFIKKEKCKSNHYSSMSSSAWTDLNSQGNTLKLHDKFPNRKCNCQKIIIFTPHHCLLESGSVKSKFSEEL